MKTKTYAQQWLKTKEAQGVSRSSIQNYERYARVHILPHFKNLDIKAIQKHYVESFQIQLKKNHNHKGVNVIITALKKLFREAIKDSYLLKSPCEFIKSLSSDTKQENYWTTSEVDQFLRANYDHELNEFFILALNTGMRKDVITAI